MRANRNAGIHNCTDLPGHGSTALQFYRIGIGLFDQAASVLYRLFYGYLITHKRHVHNNEGVLAAAHHATPIDNHLLHRHRQRSRVALHGHPKTVAYKNHVDTGCVNQAGS